MLFRSLIPGCTARFQCRTAFRYDGGDHVIFVGEVLAYDRSDEPPLVYQAGQYAIAARKPRQEVRLGATPPPECSYTEDLLGYLLGRSHYQMLFALRRLLASHALDEPAFFILSTLSVRDRLTLDELNAIPGVTAKPDVATADFVYNHTMIRVKDLTKSLDFYTRVLGFTLLEKKDFPDAEFSLYFLALINDKSQIPADPAARHQWRKSIPGVLELTYNYGTEKDPEFSYHSGNSDPRGFGHLCVSVPDIKAACQRFEDLGVDFQKRLTDGRMRDIAFIKDPDGYWVEIIQFTEVI